MEQEWNDYKRYRTLKEAYWLVGDLRDHLETIKPGQIDMVTPKIHQCNQTLAKIFVLMTEAEQKIEKANAN